MNNKSAAGLRRSAIAERIRLREEWSELKGTPEEPQTNTNKTNVLRKQNPYKNIWNKKQNSAQSKRNYDISKGMQANSEVLHGVVALVEVGAEPRALALRAALTALGATVVPAWSPLVTHVIWAQGGCRATRAKARALASRLVSPLWVEACAAAAGRLPEQAFPAAARASDLPSPRTLRHLLKKAEMENIPLLDLLSDKEEDRENRPVRLRLSSETDHDTSNDTSRDTSNDKSRDTSTDIETRVNTAPRRALPNSSVHSPHAIKSRRKLFTQKESAKEGFCSIVPLTRAKPRAKAHIETRVNTAPRRALPNSSVHSPHAIKSRRKLFTQKEDEVVKRADDDSDKDTPGGKRSRQVTQRDRRQLARAERLAKKLVAACRDPRTPAPSQGTQGVRLPGAVKPRIVLTGMDRAERHAVSEAIRKLNGRIQSQVNRKTTHVLLGSCTRSESSERNCSGVTALNIPNKTINTTSTKPSPRNTRLSTSRLNKSPKNNVTSVNNEMRVVHRSELQKARTLNSLLGAARGCRVLTAQWALDSVRNNGWLHHHGYEVPHLRKIAQKARIERTALGKMRSEYAYDVFYGMKVRVTPNAEQRDAAIQLLTLCGAVIQNGGETVQQDGGRTQNVGLTQVQQNGGLTQNGARIGQNQDFDLTVGVRNGEVSSKWVFDSVAAARMRTTRRYINNVHNTQNTQASVI